MELERVYSQSGDRIETKLPVEQDVPGFRIEPARTSRKNADREFKALALMDGQDSYGLVV